MEDFWFTIGYSGSCGEDGFPTPGELIKQTRTKKGLSQEQLALELGCSRTMVARMENENLGLNDITTRRQLSKILGIAPMMLGLISREDLAKVQPTMLYNTTLLRKGLVLHREVYFSGSSIGGLNEVDATVQQVFGISKSLDHKNKEVLEILCHYGQLGIDIGREEQNYKAVERFGNWSSSIARRLNDPTLLSSTLLRYAAAMYEKGDLARARQYADEALSQPHLSPQLYGGVLLEASRIYARNDPKTTMKFLDKATAIARKNSNEADEGFVKLTPGFCYLRSAKAFYEAQEYENALEALDMAEEQTAPTLVRRKCAIQVLQAQVLASQGHYSDATQYASLALTLASAINSAPNLAYITTLYKRLKNSSFGSSKEVNRLGKAITQTIGSRPIVAPH
ncbi:helix-turn-helix domain-containing protein [Tengunoibacter tsumagoiensis]|uniref:HTH cro/C1-type domain-containing protein n=1 Tax=Tengunoibacter tsumagoiensis TaxID=2014871 RepID=A0A402A3D1_9CHLR|nr:helix-turn-helix domain-containing protein [Tengunoibacter tsumagoiensis]GCE13660.1 hypothetical protein KTT_35190 [Tengunoibacter tsumagoiensis]